MPLQDFGQFKLAAYDRVKRSGDPVLGTKLADDLVIDVDPSKAEIVVFFVHADGTRISGHASPFELDNGRRTIGHGARRVVDIRQGLHEDDVYACFGQKKHRQEAHGSSPDDQNLTVHCRIGGFW